MKLQSLTNGERLLIQRRRRNDKQGESQRDASARFGVSLYRYRLWELDKDDPPRRKMGELAAHEECTVRRRRANVSVKALAKLVRVSPWWVTQMEHGRAPADRLISYWSGKAA